MSIVSRWLIIADVPDKQKKPHRPVKYVAADDEVEPVFTQAGQVANFQVSKMIGKPLIPQAAKSYPSGVVPLLSNQWGYSTIYPFVEVPHNVKKLKWKPEVVSAFDIIDREEIVPGSATVYQRNLGIRPGERAVRYFTITEPAGTLFRL